MTEMEKAIEKAQIALAELTQLCRGQQKALDDATFQLTMAAHDAGFLSEGSSHYNPDAWAAVVPVAVAALRMSDRGDDQWPGEMLKDCAVKCGYTVAGIQWLTKRAVDLAIRKDGEKAVNVFQVRASDHIPPARVNEALCADLCRQFAKAGA